MSGLPTSDEKNTDAVTDFELDLDARAFWQACLMMACVFWRGALIEVWKTYLSFLPSFSRMPSAPFFQPASSRILFALSTLNSYVQLARLELRWAG